MTSSAIEVCVVMEKCGHYAHVGQVKEVDFIVTSVG